MLKNKLQKHVDILQYFLKMSAVPPWWGILSDLVIYYPMTNQPVSLEKHRSICEVYTQEHPFFCVYFPTSEAYTPVAPRLWGSPRALWPLAWDFWKRFCLCSRRQKAWKPLGFLLLSPSHSIVKDKWHTDQISVGVGSMTKITVWVILYHSNGIQRQVFCFCWEFKGKLHNFFLFKINTI